MTTKKEWSKMVLAPIRMKVRHRSEMSVAMQVIPNDKEWRAEVHHSDGSMTWEWVNTRQEGIEWCERNKGFDIVQYVENVLRGMWQALHKNAPIQVLWRHAAAIEAAMISVGELEVGKPYEIIRTKKRFFGIPYVEKESYYQRMMRMAIEWLDKQENG